MKPIYLLILWNLIVFVIYGIDKRKAVKSRWRIPERVLILLAFLMGGAGALAGMYFFRHKTQKPKFYILVPLCFILNLLAIFFGDFF